MDPYAQLHQYHMGFVPQPQQPPGVQIPPLGIQIPPLPPLQQQQQQQQQMGGQLPRPAEGAGPVRYLFVGGFPAGTTQDELLPVMEAFGPVEAMRINTAKACCFVRYVELEGAIAAHDRMHGTMFKGSFLRVGWGKMDLQDDPSQSSRILWVGNIDPLATEGEIAHLFGAYGQILQVKVLPAKFCSFVSFHSVEDAVRARVALNGYNFMGKPLRINFRKLEISSLGEFPSAYIRLEDLPIRQVLPPPPEVKQVIDTFATYVLKNGQEFEASSKARAAARLSFLDPSDPAHEYYRWKVYDGWGLRDRATQVAASYRNALANLRKQKEQQQQQQQSLPEHEPQVQITPQQMIDVAPKMGEVEKEDEKGDDKEDVRPAEKEVPREEKADKERQVPPQEAPSESVAAESVERRPEENLMTSDERARLVEMLGRLEPKKSVIKGVGEWAKKRNGSAREISEVLWRFFSGLGRGEFERKVSVMYLVSDVTSLDERYRKGLEKVVGGIVDGVIQDSRGEEDLERVGDLLGLWERSKVFPDGTLKRQLEECERSSSRASEPDRKRRRRRHEEHN